ncbi:MAG: SGNH/GDSL hydrolase family protein, partial [Acidimicrobiia bacterium]
SDTVGVGASDPENESWAAIINRRFPKGGTFLKLGVSGSTADQALAEQVPQAVEADADLITVWLAVNDLNQFIPPETYAATLHEILTKLTANGARVFVGNLPDLSKVPVYTDVPKPLIDQRVGQYNRQIQKTASETGAVLVNLFDVYEEAGHKNGSLISSDGFHPSEAGYVVIADAYWTAIKNDPKIGPRVSR